MSLKDNYEALRTGENIAEVTENIKLLYSMDGALQEWAELLKDPESVDVHMYAATGLRLLLGVQWKDIKDSLTPEILGSFIELMQIQNEKNIELIVFGLTKVFEYLGDTWTDIYDFAFSIMDQSQNPRVAAIILVSALKYCSSEFIAERAEPLFAFIQENYRPITAAMPAEEANHVFRIMNIFAIMLTRDPPIFDPYPEEVVGMFNAIFQGYIEFITQQYPVLGLVESTANKLADIVQQMVSATNPVVDPTAIISGIVEAFQNPNINSDLSYTLLTPLYEVIVDYTEETRESFGDLLGLILKFAESRYDDGQTYNNQAYDIADVANAIASNMLPSEFLQLLLQSIDTSTEGGIYAGIFALDETMSEITESIEESPSQVMELLLSVFGNSEILVEGSVSALTKMAGLIPGVCEQYSTEVLQAAYAYLESEEEETVDAVLNLFVEIFENVSIDTTTVKSVVEGALAVFQANDSLKASAMKVFASAIQCAQETSVSFFGEISEAIIAFFQSEESEAAPIKCAAVECIGNVISFCPDCVSENIDELIGGILGNLAYNEEEAFTDLDVQRSSLMAMKTIMENRINDLEIKDVAVVITSLIGVTLTVFDRFYDEYANSNDEEKRENMIGEMKGILNIQTAAFKFAPEQLKEFAGQMQEQESSEHWKLLQIIEQTFKLYFEQEEELIPELLELGAALLYYSDPNGEEPPEFWALYFECLTSVFSQEYDKESTEEDALNNWIDVITHALNVIGDLTEEGSVHPMIAQNANDYFMLAVQTIHRDLPISKCLGESAFRYDPELIPSAQTVIINMITTFKDGVDITAFVQSSLEIVEKISDAEKCIMFATLSVLPQYIEMPEEIIQLASQIIQLCDFSHSPDPIFFFNQMLQYRAAQISEIISDLYTVVTTLLQNEPTKDRYYWETVSNSASLALLIYKAFPTQIDISDLLPHIANKIPYKGDYEEGRNVVMNILDLFVSQRDTVLQNAGEIFRGLSVTVSLNDMEFNKYRFSAEDLGRINEFIRFVMENSAELQGQLGEILGGDEIKFAQFTKRTGIEFQ